MRRTLTALVVALVSLAALPALAGGSFRLDIGQSFADSRSGKLKDAVLLVRGLACDDSGSIAITGSAEGLVDGARRSVPLALHKLATPGVFAVRRQWPAGRWVLHLEGRCPGANAVASVLVPLDGTSRFIRARIQHSDGRTAASAVEAALRTAPIGG